MPDGPFILEVKAAMNLERVSQEYLDTCEEISAFLQDSDRALAAVVKLEGELHAEIIARGGDHFFQFKDDLDKLISVLSTPGKPNGMPDNDWKDIKGYTTHILTNVLSRNELNFEFTLFYKSGRKYGQPITLVLNIEPGQFRRIIQEGKMWKDPGAGGGHGEFTHRIQWYLILNSIQKDASFWVPFYKWIGTIKRKDNVSNPEQGLWDALLDRSIVAGNPYMAAAATDYRCPEKLLAFLISTENKSNMILQAFLNGRKAKRENEPYTEKLRRGNSALATAKILAKEIFGIELERLNARDIKQLALIVINAPTYPDNWVPSIIEPSKPGYKLWGDGESQFLEMLKKANQSSGIV